MIVSLASFPLSFPSSASPCSSHISSRLFPFVFVLLSFRRHDFSSVTDARRYGLHLILHVGLDLTSERPLVVWLGGAAFSSVLPSTLVARLFSPVLFQLDSLEAAFGRAWPVVRIISNVFLIEFSSMNHLKLILCHGPWSFDNRLVIMVMTEKGDCSSSVQFSCVDFSVHVLDVLFEWHTKILISF